MSLPLESFGLRLSNIEIPTYSRCYRPPHWPPPKDWVISVDKSGNPLSYYGDSIWDFSPWAGKVFRLDLSGDNVKKGVRPQKIEGKNLDILRVVAAWFLWGPDALREIRTFKTNFVIFRRFISFCTENGVQANSLSRFPALLDKYISIVPSSAFSKNLYIFHKLWERREEIGIELLDQRALARLAEFNSKHEVVQTAYIPPRIWGYQMHRLRQCIDDFNAHRGALEECFNFCLNAYSYNFGSLERALDRKGIKNQSRLPFQDSDNKHRAVAVDAVVHGSFSKTLERYSLEELFNRWIPRPKVGWTIKQFSTYFSLVQLAGRAYLTSFTLQRADECQSLRSDCLLWEDDPKLGRIPMICGETTKTNKDSDARWPTSPSVELAMNALISIAKMRMRCAVSDPYAKPSSSDQVNPRLFDRAYEPWAGRNDASITYSLRPTNKTYKKELLRFPKLFDSEVLKIKEDDLRIALLLTPNLRPEDGYSIGAEWPLAWHQLRRTSAVNMFASGLLSDSSLQFQMKHASRLMPLYYVRGYNRLPVSEGVGPLIITSMYEVMSHRLMQLTSERYVSPYGAERKAEIMVKLIGEKTAQQLSIAGSRGETAFREMLLGACTRVGPCPYGGIESVSRCGGGDGKGPCADALFDRNKNVSVRDQLRLIKMKMKELDRTSVQFKALQSEMIAMEIYINALK